MDNPHTDEYVSHMETTPAPSTARAELIATLRERATTDSPVHALLREAADWLTADAEEFRWELARVRVEAFTTESDTFRGRLAALESERDALVRKIMALDDWFNNLGPHELPEGMGDRFNAILDEDADNG